MTGNAENARLLLVPCPDCGEFSAEPLQRIADNDVIPCSLCGGLIDLGTEECREIVTQARSLLAGGPVAGRAPR